MSRGTVTLSFERDTCVSTCFNCYRLIAGFVPTDYWIAALGIEYMQWLAYFCAQVPNQRAAVLFHYLMYLCVPSLTFAVYICLAEARQAICDPKRSVHSGLPFLCLSCKIEMFSNPHKTQG